MRYLLILAVFSSCAVISADTELTDHYIMEFSGTSTTPTPRTAVFSKTLDDSIPEGLARVDNIPKDNKHVDSLDLDVSLVSDMVTSNTNFQGISRITVNVRGLDNNGKEATVFIVDHTLTEAEKQHRVLYLDPINSDLGPATNAIRAVGSMLDISLTVTPSQLTASIITNDLTIHVGLVEKVSL